MAFNSSGSEDGSSEWESIDFISKYTTQTQPKIDYGSPEEDHCVITENNPNTVVWSIISPVMKMEQGEPFCTKENIESRVKYLSQELTVLGFPSLEVREPDNGMRFNVIQLVNCTHELLRIQRQAMKKRSDLEERQMRSDSDYDALFQNQAKLKEDLETTKREECMSKLREKQLQEKVKKLQLELKVEREEIKKIKSDVQQKFKQFNHEAKRKEKELAKLKERLHQLLTDNKKENKRGIEISNTLTRADGKRGTWKGVKRDDEEVYKAVIASYDARHKELVSDNTSLREYLGELLDEYIDLLKKQCWTVDDIETDPRIEDIKPELLKGHFSMPFHIVKDDIQSNFRAAFDVLKQRLEQGSSKGSTPLHNSPHCDDEKEQLKQQLDSCRDVINKQDELIRELQSGLLNREGQVTSPGEEEALKERLKTLSEEKENLRTDRRTFTEFAVKLASEREAFEREKIDFYKTCFSTPVIAAVTAKDSRKDKEGVTRRQLPVLTSSTPMFSPAPRDPNNNSKQKRTNSIPTPSTTELYRFMSMLEEKKENIESTKGNPNSIAEEQTPVLPRRKSSSARQRSGSYNTDESGWHMKPITLDYVDSLQRSRRVAEHAEKVKQALENHHRSLEETPPQLFAGDE